MGNARENESGTNKAIGFNLFLFPVVDTYIKAISLYLLKSLFLGQSGDCGPGPVSWS